MLGLGLAEKEGLNQYLALPNKFFEYIHAGLPQVAMNFPEYQKINGQYKVAVLLDQLSIEKISEAINAVMENNSLLEELHRNCLKAREIYCWQNEEKELIKFYQTIFQSE
jgi:glycosyltransferase involved in cell wall biosynthesis